MKFIVALFLAALVCGAFAQRDNLHTPGHFILDGCAVEDPTYLEFWIDEAGEAHIQHHEMEYSGINLIDFHNCGGAPMVTLNRCPVPGQSIIGVPGAIRYNPNACGGTQDIEGFLGVSYVSLTNLVCSASRNTRTNPVRAVAAAETLSSGNTVAVTGNTFTLSNGAEELSTVVLADEAHLGTATVVSSTVAVVADMPVVSMELSNGAQLQFDCLNESCTSASVNIAHESVIAEACTMENSGEFAHDAGVVSACTRLPQSTGAASLFMWVPLGNNVQSHL